MLVWSWESWWGCSEEGRAAGIRERWAELPERFLEQNKVGGPRGLGQALPQLWYEAQAHLESSLDNNNHLYRTYF